LQHHLSCPHDVHATTAFLSLRVLNQWQFVLIGILWHLNQK